MPNWTFNIITTKNPSILPTFVTKKDFDFNTIIPMPESLNIADSIEMDMAIGYYVTKRLTIPCEQTNLNKLVYNIFDSDWAKEVCTRLQERVDSGESLEELYKMGEQYMYNLENYGFYTWYDWCCINWGTKWNACDTDMENPCCVTFDTAWDAPIPIFKKICELFPNEEIAFESSFEDGGTVGYENNGGSLEIIYERHDCQEA